MKKKLKNEFKLLVLTPRIHQSHLEGLKARSHSWRRPRQGSGPGYFSKAFQGAPMFPPGQVTDFRLTGALWVFGAFVWGYEKLFLQIY